MTREEAIEILKTELYYDEKVRITNTGWERKSDEAHLMAIKALSQEPCEKSMNKAYEFGKNKGVGVYWNKQTDTVELPEAVFRYILSLVPTDKEIEA